MSSKVNVVAAAQHLQGMAKLATALKEENSTLREKLAWYERKEECEKIVDDLEARSKLDAPRQEKVAQLMNHQNLDAVREALSLDLTPNVSVGSLTGDPSSGGMVTPEDNQLLDFLRTT